jgi:hypothetical protein
MLAAASGTYAYLGTCPRRTVSGSSLAVHRFNQQEEKVTRADWLLLLIDPMSGTYRAVTIQAKRVIERPRSLGLASPTRRSQVEGLLQSSRAARRSGVPATAFLAIYRGSNLACAASASMLPAFWSGAPTGCRLGYARCAEDFGVGVVPASTVKAILDSRGASTLSAGDRDAMLAQVTPLDCLESCLCLRAGSSTPFGWLDGLTADERQGKQVDAIIPDALTEWLNTGSAEAIERWTAQAFAHNGFSPEMVAAVLVAPA